MVRPLTWYDWSREFSTEQVQIWVTTEALKSSCFDFSLFCVNPCRWKDSVSFCSLTVLPNVRNFYYTQMLEWFGFYYVT